MALCVASAPLRAQEGAPPPARPAGLRLQLATTVGGTSFDRSSDALWQRVGTFGVGPGVEGAVGYAWQSFGVTGAVERSWPSVDSEAEHAGQGLAVAVTADWRSKWAPGGWTPGISVGFARHVIGATSVRGAEFPAVQAGDGAPPEFFPPTYKATMQATGNGGRIALSARRSLTRAVSVGVDARADVVRFASLLYSGTDYEVIRPGWSRLPRLAVALSWYPLAARR